MKENFKTMAITKTGIAKNLVDMTKEMGLATSNTEAQKVAEAFVDATFASIVKIVGEGQSVTIKDFGLFKRKVRKARTVKNPNTGEDINVPEKTVIGFTSKHEF